MPSKNRIRNFCFTLNNPDTNGGLELCDWLDEHCAYVIIGLEVGGETSTPHYQGYAELRKQMPWDTVARAAKWHIERRIGTVAAARKYCTKEGNFIEHGKISEQGARRDLDAVRQLALDEGMRAVTRTCNLQQIKVAEKFLTYNEEERDWECVGHWFTGPPGSGKSRSAYELANKLCDEQGWSYYVKNDPGVWYDGYDGHEIIILDDFRPTWMPLTDLLTLCDRYPKRLQYKGGYRQCKARVIIITSVVDRDHAYGLDDVDRTQLTRRFARIDVTDAPAEGELDVPEEQPELAQNISDCFCDACALPELGLECKEVRMPLGHRWCL